MKEKKGTGKASMSKSYYQNKSQKHQGQISTKNKDRGGPRPLGERQSRTTVVLIVLPDL